MTVPYTGVLVNTPVPRSLPREGAKALWASILWSNVAPDTSVQITIPLHLVSTISQIVSIYVDNTQSFVPIMIQAIDTQQRIIIPAGLQGVYSIYTSSTNINISQVIPDPIFSVTNIYFLNYYEVPWIQPGKTLSIGEGSQTGATSVEFQSTIPVSNAILLRPAGHISAIYISGVVTVSVASEGFFAITDIAQSGSGMNLWQNRTLFANGAQNFQSFVSGINCDFGWQPAGGGLGGLEFNWSVPDLTNLILDVVLYQ